MKNMKCVVVFFFQAEDGIRDWSVTGVQTCALPICRRFGIARPRLALAGLNPHAGESGSLGDEDAAVVAPAVAALVREGIAASGPYPADTMFHAAARAGYDVALAMY